MKSKIINYKNTIAFIAVLFIVTAAKEVKAQNTVLDYTQYMDNLTPYNPAYSMLDKAGSVNMVARKQWVGIDGSPASFLINGNVPLDQINGATGFIVQNDQFAIERVTEANVYFAKGIQVGLKDYLAVSLNAGIRNYVANFSQVDPTDPIFAQDVRQTKPNVGFGVMYYTDRFYVGISVPELTITSLGTASVQSSTNFRNNYYFSAAMITDLDNDIKFKPAMLISYTNGVPLAGDLSGTFYLKETVGVGADIRSNGELAGILTINVDSFRIGYSYQFGTSTGNLAGLNNATHEVTLSYRFGKGAKGAKLL